MNPLQKSLLEIISDIWSEKRETRGSVSSDTLTSDESFAAQIADKRTNVDFCNGFNKYLPFWGGLEYSRQSVESSPSISQSI